MPHIQIGDIAPRIQYVADGLQTLFPYPFPVLSVGDVRVWGGGTRLASGYTVTGAGSSSGGTVRFDSAPPAGTVITLVRHMALARTSDLPSDGLIRTKVLNDEFDYQVLASQQLAEELGRAVRRAPTSVSGADLTLPDPVPRRALIWNDSGTGLALSRWDPDADGDAEAAARTAMAAAAQAVRSAAAINLPQSLVGKAQRYLRVLPDESGYEHRSAAQVFNDLTGFSGWRGLTFTRVAVTVASYAVSNADKGKTLAASGGLSSLNFGANSTGFDADFCALVVNEDAARGKTIVINGGNFTLWPGQSLLVWVGSPGGAWRTSERHRWTLTSDVILYVNPSTGSDVNGNDGLHADSAFSTITAAYKVASQYFDIGGKWAVTIKLADGTYTESLMIAGHPVGRHLIFIEGNTYAPQTVVWYAGSDGYCIFATDYGAAIVKGVSFSAVNKICLQSTQSGILDIDYPTSFSSSDGGVHMLVQDGGHINILGPYAITGNASTHIQAKENGRVSLGGGFAVEIGQPINVGYFLSVTSGGVVSTNGLPVTYTNAGNCSGYRYSVHGNGVIRSGGTTFPGSAAGVTGSGGQYL